MAPEQLTLDFLLPILLKSAALFLGILLVLLLVEWALGGRRSLPACRERRTLNFNLFADALLWAVPITFLTLALSQAATWLAGAFGLELPPQDLILILQNEATPTATRWAIALFALLEAPLLEEGIFRRVIFRNLLRKLTPVVAMILSGALFALVHFNAITFLPLWFIGAALAWTYHRTGRLLVPMIVHFLFNLTNLLLLFAFPEMT